MLCLHWAGGEHCQLRPFADPLLAPSCADSTTTPGGIHTYDDDDDDEYTSVCRLEREEKRQCEQQQQEQQSKLRDFEHRVVQDLAALAANDKLFMDKTKRVAAPWYALLPRWVQLTLPAQCTPY